MTEDNKGKMVDPLIKKIQGIYTIDERYLDILFTFLFISWISAILLLTPQYDRDAQLFPLIVSIPTFIALLFAISIQLSPRLKEEIERYTANTDLVIDQEPDDTSGEETRSDDAYLVGRRKRVYNITLWMVASFLIILIFGFSIGMFLFIIVFYRVKADMSWKESLIYTLIIWLFIFGTFTVVLNTPFYEGVLFEEILSIA